MDSKFYFRLIVFTLLGLVNAQWAAAQNVTISPQNGSMICALTAGSPSTQYGFQVGAFATWRHNQLSLTMTASNDKDLTEDGQLKNHANHFMSGDKCTFNPALTANDKPATWIDCGWGGSNSNEGYFTIALPKGYRFTGYKFDMTHDISSVGQGNTFTITTNTTVSISETGSNFGAAIKTATLPAESNTVVTLSDTRNDMGNILYFKTTAPVDGYFDITFRYVELTFTADADTPISILPSSQVSNGHSLLEIPFNTGKVDLGEIKQGSYQGAQRVSYQYNSVTDMSANMLLYEYESTKTGTALDGTQGLVAYNKTTGSITTSGEYFKFSPSSNKAEQKYVLETPVSATMSNSKDNPVQFRITEATIHYSSESSNTFHITFTDDNGTKYYLTTTNGRFSTTEQTVWSIDDDGHIKSGNNYLYGTDGHVNTTTRSSSATTYSIDENGNIRYRRYNGSFRYLKAYPNYSWEYQGGNWEYVLSYYTGYMTDSNDYTTATTEGIQDEAHTGAELYVYDKEGNTKETFTISGKGTKTLYDLNNDAIIFGVKGGKVALVNFELKLQALNPYIDQMTVALNDNVDNKNIRQTRTFTADDFSVGGGTFRFYLPKDCINDYITITFEDLYSKYGDETYDHTDKAGTSNSRYNFVKSQHHLKFTDDNIYNGKAEAASDQKESDRIAKDQNVRTKVGTVGDTPFRFNNADELSNHTGYLTEYPFTLYNYENQTNPDAGKFITAEFNSPEVDETLHDKTFYVFTTDETRYNIAPTTATQHRFYAFYAMKVEVICQDYEPVVEFEPVYEKTLTEAANGGVDESSFFGVKVTGPAGVESPLASDVATYKAISKAVEKGDDVNIPKTLKQILYVDLSALNGVYHSNGTGVDEDEEEDEDYSLASFDKLRKKLAPNALIFLPVNSTDRFDNFAYAKKGEVAGSFQSANNIILTDKSPFYTPYTIQVDAANYATYTRLRTAASEDLVKKATVVLPFTMKVTGGKHKNDTEDGFEFNLRELKKLTAQTGTDQYGTEGVEEGKGNFVLIEGEETKANYPYMVEVTSANGSEYSFIAAQKGSNIVATPETITGETAGGLTNTGTYSGVKLPTATKSFYYFTRDKYVSNVTAANNKYADVYVQPFRAYYVAPTAGSKLSMFEIVYDELDENEGLITGITTARSHGPLSVATGHGYITLTSAEDINVTVYSIKGAMVANMKMSAGEQQNINVPAGVYLVNKNKVIVK